MKAKYQVFISSTYQDLIREREILVKAILEMGHIPVGMEMFSAGDEQQWELIKRTIDDCDYYIVIVAHRYGSVDGNIGYTEKEYDYATSKGIPTLGFVIDDAAPWPKDKMDTDLQAKASLEQFKEKIKKKIINFWTGHEDLYPKVCIALSKATTAYPRPGWVRVTSAVNPEVMNEMSRLSKENSALRSTIDSIESQRRLEDAENGKEKRIIQILGNRIVPVSLFFKDGAGWTRVGETSLFQIFHLLAPELLVEVSVERATAFLAAMLRPEEKMETPLRPRSPIPKNTMQGWLADLHALGLIAPSSKKHAVKDIDEYWSITEAGKSIAFMIRLAALEAKPSVDEASGHGAVPT